MSEIYVVTAVKENLVRGLQFAHTMEEAERIRDRAIRSGWVAVTIRQLENPETQEGAK